MNNDFRTTNDPKEKLDQLRRRKEDQPEEILTLEDEDEDIAPEEYDGRCFSVVSADRPRKLAVELRFIDGDGTAPCYSYLVRTDWLKSKAIKLDFSGFTVEIQGRNLRPIYQGLIAQRVAWVREIDDLQARANLPESATVVTKIKVMESGEGEDGLQEDRP